MSEYLEIKANLTPFIMFIASKIKNLFVSMRLTYQTVHYVVDTFPDFYESLPSLF